MSSQSKHYKDEVGTDLILDTGILIGTVAFQYIKYKKPDGVTTGSWDASLYDSYSELAKLTGTYLLLHTLDVGELDQSGEWRFQAWVGAVDGTWFGEVVKENIYDEFE